MMVVTDFVAIVVLTLACVYTLASSMLIYSALARITGKELKHLIVALFITVISGFFYGLMSLLSQLELINPGREIALNYFNNFLLFTMFVMLIYLSFLTRELGKRFGFKHVGKKIKKRLDSKKRRKHIL